MIKAYNPILPKANRMKKTQMSILALSVLLLTAVSIFYSLNNNKAALSESEAISLLKAVYPEFKNYPNDNLPPQSLSLIHI